MIIDEKGRLFGFINLIDLMVVIAVLIAIYIGITLVIVSRQPPLTIETIEPAVVENSLSQTITVSFDNYRRLDFGTVTLLPHTGTSSSKSFPLQIHRFVRDKATFQVSNLDPGTYHLKFDIQTKDVLRRTHQVSEIIESALTVEGWDGIPGLNEKNLQIEIHLLADKDNQIVSDSIKIGDRLKIPELNVDVSVLKIGEVESDPDKMKDAVVARKDLIPMENKLELTLAGRMSYINLSNLINYYLSAAKPIEIVKGENSLNTDVLLIRERTTREITDRIKLDLPFVFMAIKPSQLEELQNNKFIVDEEGYINAEIKSIDGYRFPDQDTESSLNEKLVAAANKIVDMYLTVSIHCRIQDDGLYFDGKLLTEDNLFGFKFGEVTVYGKLKSQQHVARIFKANIVSESVSNSLLDLVYDGMPVLDRESTQVVGRIRKIVSKEKSSLELFENSEFSGLFNRAVLEVEFYTQVANNNIQLSDGQVLSQDNSLNLSVLSQTLIFQLQTKKHVKTAQTFWKEFSVDFHDLDENTLKYIHEGQKNLIETGVAGIVIKKVLMKYNSPKEVTLWDGTIAMSPHPVLFNIRCNVSMQVKREGNFFYYNDNPILIGQDITFGTDKVSVQFKIRDF